jgi:hypothetical protein
MLDTIDKVFIGAILGLIVAVGSSIYYGLHSQNVYEELCNSKGGEVIRVAGGPNLCRDGSTLINVYKDMK